VEGKAGVGGGEHLLIKTRAELFGSLAQVIRRVHPYEVPEIVELQIEKGNKPYLHWIAKETRTAPRRKSVVVKRRSK
jgi:periplasmic divalent cation tolerance protein